MAPPPEQGQGRSPGQGLLKGAQPLRSRRAGPCRLPPLLGPFSFGLPPPPPTPPPQPGAHSPALHDLRAAAHCRSAAGRGRHAHPGLGALLALRRLLEGLACRSLPGAPRGGLRCRGREEGEREPLEEGTGREGAPGAHLQPQPEAAGAPVTERQLAGGSARAHRRAYSLTCAP